MELTPSDPKPNLVVLLMNAQGLGYSPPKTVKRSRAMAALDKIRKRDAALLKRLAR